jgi:hypothetical protein
MFSAFFFFFEKIYLDMTRSFSQGNEWLPPDSLTLRAVHPGIE